MRNLPIHRGRQLSEQRIIIERPESASIRRDDNLVSLECDVSERSIREILHQRLPMVAVVERDVHSTLSSGEKQSCFFRVVADDSGEAAADLARRKTVDDLRPRVTVITRSIEIRRVITDWVKIHSSIRCCRIEV